MKNIFLFLGLFTISFGSSQNLDNLDTKNGINKFKLGSAFDLYKNELEYEGTSNGLKLYNGKKLESLNILNKDVRELSLTFYKNKLHSINIVLKISNEKEEMEVLRKLESLFGNASEGETETPTFNYEWAYLWKTNNVYLGYNKMAWKSEFKPGVSSIYMISLKLQQQLENDSF